MNYLPFLPLVPETTHHYGFSLDSISSGLSLKIVIPAKAGIQSFQSLQRRTGCRITSGMTEDVDSGADFDLVESSKYPYSALIVLMIGQI
jgi:hypothetical protein